MNLKAHGVVCSNLRTNGQKFEKANFAGGGGQLCMLNAQVKHLEASSDTPTLSRGRLGEKKLKFEQGVSLIERGGGFLLCAEGETIHIHRMK